MSEEFKNNKKIQWMGESLFEPIWIKIIENDTKVKELIKKENEELESK